MLLAAIGAVCVHYPHFKKNVKHFLQCQKNLTKQLICAYYLHMDKKLIKQLGGASKVAALLNKHLLDGDSTITRQRVHNWIKADHIPPYFKVAYKRVWAKAIQNSIRI